MQKTIRFKNSINDLTISQFMRSIPILNALNEENVNELIPIFTDTTAEELDYNARAIIYEKLQTVDYSLSTGYTDTVLGEYKLQDFDEMTFGEYIYLKGLFKDIYGSLDLIIACLYRRKRKFAQHSVTKRRDLFNDRVSIGEVCGVIKKFNDFDAELSKLSLPNKDGYVEEEDEEETEMQKHIKRWNYWITIDHLADGKLLKYEKVLKIPVRDVFLYYTFKTLDNQIKNKVN